MAKKGQILSDEFLICIRIYEFNQEGEDIWFSKLVKSMNGSPSQSTISKCIDRLFDRGMINGEWKKVGSRWTRTFMITGEFKGFVKGLYEITEEFEE
jgi:DNA-binding PadR family transcriptional regulator